MQTRQVKIALGVTFGVLLGLLVFLLWLLFRGSHIIQLLLATVVLGFTIALLSGVFALGLILLFKKPLPQLERLALWTLGLLYPLAQKFSTLFGVSSQTLAQSFIALNNRLVQMKKIKAEPRQLLLLLPHCLQWEGCPHKLDSRSRGCKNCGSCQLGELRKLASEYGIDLALATGGTLARKVIGELEPKCVVAVACERDLLSGIMETKPLAVYGVLNLRPQGPCKNTKVSLSKVREAIELFLKREV